MEEGWFVAAKIAINRNDLDAFRNLLDIGQTDKDFPYISLWEYIVKFDLYQMLPALMENMSEHYYHPNLLIGAIGFYATKCIETILERGANVHQLDSWGRTALHEAARCNEVDTCKLLIQYGAKVDTDEIVTPLYWAIQWHSLECVEFLVESGARIPSHVFPLDDGELDEEQEANDRAIGFFLRYIVPARIKRCQDAVMTLILSAKRIRSGHRASGNQTLWGQVDRHNVLAVAKLVWQSRRDPVWTFQKWNWKNLGRH